MTAFLFKVRFNLHYLPSIAASVTDHFFESTDAMSRKAPSTNRWTVCGSSQMFSVYFCKYAGYSDVLKNSVFLFVLEIVTANNDRFYNDINELGGPCRLNHISNQLAIIGSSRYADLQISEKMLIWVKNGICSFLSSATSIFAKKSGHSKSEVFTTNQCKLHASPQEKNREKSTILFIHLILLYSDARWQKDYATRLELIGSISLKLPLFP